MSDHNHDPRPTTPHRQHGRRWTVTVTVTVDLYDFPAECRNPMCYVSHRSNGSPSTSNDRHIVNLIPLSLHATSSLSRTVQLVLLDCVGASTAGRPTKSPAPQGLCSCISFCQCLHKLPTSLRHKVFVWSCPPSFPLESSFERWQSRIFIPQQRCLNQANGSRLPSQGTAA